MGIKKELNKIQKETLRAQASVKERIEFWKTHTLAESLYNDGKTPRPQDVAQVSSRKFDSYGLGDCYLLANLINIARTKPRLITNGMIKFKSADEVELRFFEAIMTFDKSFNPPSEQEVLSDPSKLLDLLPKSYSYESTRKHIYSVKKEEVLKLIHETHHKALWPLVIEIGFAKHIIETHKTLNIYEYTRLLTLKAININKIAGTDISQRYASLAAPSYDIKTLVKYAYDEKGGIAPLTYTELTGIKSETVEIDASKMFPDLKKFSKTKKYTAEAEKIYTNIETKLKQSRDITITFKGLRTTALQNQIQKSTKISLMNDFKNKSAQDIQPLLNNYFSMTILEWLETKNYFNDDQYRKTCDVYAKLPGIFDNSRGKHIIFRILSDKHILQFIDECDRRLVGGNSDTTAISKTKEGLLNDHAYAVVGCFEHEGYKYIVIQNPHDVKTKIDYSKSKKLPPEVKLPKDLPKGLTSRNQCMMELNHFCKHLDTINYS